MIGSIGRTTAILQKYDLRAKKALGQNFIIDENILQKTVSFSEISKNDGVIEIGPGIGALTEVLLMNAKKVLAYEIDERFINILSQELSNQENLKVIHADFLKTHLEEDFSFFEDCKRVFVISNIPYYITTPIVSKLLRSRLGIHKIILLIQKEVGERLIARPNTKDYGAFTVFVQAKSQVKIGFLVSSNCFIPKPDVDSVVVEIIPGKNSRPLEEQFFKFVQNIFENRRKTLMNNLLRSYSFTRLQIEEVFMQQNINLNTRSENLDLNQIYDLFIQLNKQ